MRANRLRPLRAKALNGRSKLQPLGEGSISSRDRSAIRWTCRRKPLISDPKRPLTASNHRTVQTTIQEFYELEERRGNFPGTGPGLSYLRGPATTETDN